MGGRDRRGHGDGAAPRRRRLAAGAARHGEDPDPRPEARPKGNPPIPQVAAALSAGGDLVESALWVDGVELLEKGGGLTPTSGTIYGAPATALTRGRHTAIAYARTATHALAVAWTFSV